MQLITKQVTHFYFKNTDIRLHVRKTDVVLKTTMSQKN